jgi:hypothetical protein
MTREKKHLTSATKSNGISLSMPYWDERAKAMAAKYPQVRTDHAPRLPQSRCSGRRSDRESAAGKPEDSRPRRQGFDCGSR